MSRYIDADKLKPKTERWLEMDDYDHEREYFISYYPLSEIENAPTEEVQPIVRGKWEWNGDYICSECGGISSRTKYPFCPNCGAKMVEIEEGE